MESVYFSTRHIQINHQGKEPNNLAGESFAMGFEPGPNSSSKYGNLYLAFEYNLDDKRININKIIKGCGRAFYESGPDVSLEKRFRLCLRALNELITQSKGAYNIAILATVGDDILFANTGKVMMLFLRNHLITNISSDKPERLFSQIGEGKIHHKDRIIMASSVIARYSSKQLADVASKLNLEDLKLRLAGELKLNTELSYSLIAIEASKSTDTSQPVATTDIQSSSKVKAMLGGSLATIHTALKKGQSAAKRTAYKSATTTKTKIMPAIADNSRRGWTRFWAKYINPKPKKAIIVVIITTIIITGVIWAIVTTISSNNGGSSQLAKALSQVASAESAINSGNKDSAQGHIDSAKQILSQINTTDRQKLNDLARTKASEQGYDALGLKIRQLEDKLEVVERIPTSSGFSIVQANLSSLVWSVNTLYGLDASGGSIIEINPLFGVPFTKATNADLIGSKSADSINDIGLVLLGKTGLWQFTPADGLIQLKASALPSAVSVVSYINNIYLLSPDDNQIIRYSKSGTTLGSKTNLLKSLSPGELKAGSSMIVEGNIFIAQGNSIRLFERGQERNYKLTNLPKSFGEISTLYYNASAGYFLALNKGNNRVALLSAEADSASYVRSYALDNNASIYSFTLEPKNSQLFINTDYKVITYKIEK